MVRDTTIDRRCKHCNEPLTGNPKKIYCSDYHRDLANGMIYYQRIRVTNPEKFNKIAERRRQYAKKWRQRNIKEGKCSRCKDINDNADMGYTVCSKCRMTIQRK